jgi:hypoxanthine phosphoribosyltransferase
MAVTYEFVWWERLYELTFILYRKIVDSGYVPDVIVGIARGGWIPARILSDMFFTRNTANVKVDLYRGIYEREASPRVSQPIPEDVKWKRPLMVDDVSDSGESLTAAMNHLQSRGLKNIRTACLHIKPWTSFVPDFYVVRTEAWVVYPWELKEFTYILAAQLLKEGVSIEDIEGRLVGLGIPMHFAHIFLEQWQTTEGQSEAKRFAKLKR